MNWMRLFGLLLSLGAVSVAQEQLSFMGYRVVIEEKPRADDFFPEAPASLCLVSETGKQCYEAPKDFGRNANAEVIRLDKDSSALLFSVASGGVSGFEIHYVLLRPGQRLENLFGMGIKVTNQSQRRFIEEPKVSDASVFVTVTSLVGMLESHSSPHRFIVSSYLRLRDGDWGSPRYQLADQFMTVRFYDLEQKPDIIAAERKMIRSRLQQAVAAFPRWYRRKI